MSAAPNTSAANLGKRKRRPIVRKRKRLKRLLRNRVSAQQARERKKAYMSTLEDERRNMETKMAELEAKINTLERENFMLRQVVKNATQGKTGGKGGQDHEVPA